MQSLLEVLLLKGFGSDFNELTGFLFYLERKQFGESQGFILLVECCSQNGIDFVNVLFFQIIRFKCIESRKRLLVLHDHVLQPWNDRIVTKITLTLRNNSIILVYNLHHGFDLHILEHLC